ncbi:MAG: phosphate ABC transporter substrate-binding protein [Acidobacteriota bacterium]
MTRLLPCLLLVALSLGCSRPDPDLRLILTGSSTVAPLATEIAHHFESENPGIRVDVQSGGSSRGVADTRRGLADIGMISRDLLPEETDLIAHVIARDGIGVIVHADNPIQRLSSTQLRAIYTRAVTDWAELGGAPGRITVVNKAAGRATLAVFLEHLQLRPDEVSADVVIGENEHGIKTVAGDPGAIGYVSIGAAEHDRGLGIPVRLVELDGVTASRTAVATGRYPMSRPLCLVTHGPPAGLARRFIDHARSESAHELAATQSFVPASS